MACWPGNPFSMYLSCCGFFLGLGWTPCSDFTPDPVHLVRDWVSALCNVLCPPWRTTSSTLLDNLHFTLRCICLLTNFSCFAQDKPMLKRIDLELLKVMLLASFDVSGSSLLSTVITTESRMWWWLTSGLIKKNKKGHCSRLWLEMWQVLMKNFPVSL